jgi:cadmium resistance protein CadD (predicted permease)
VPLNSLLSVIGLGVVVFITTDIDDLLLLSAFFADQTIHTRAIVLGQFAGIGALTAISVVAALFALAVPEGWVGLLGLVPLALGGDNLGVYIPLFSHQLSCISHCRSC